MAHLLGQLESKILFVPSVKGVREYRWFLGSKECEDTVGSSSYGVREEGKGREGKGRKGEMGGKENIRKFNGKNGAK